MAIGTISNGETGVSVRAKLNTVIGRVENVATQSAGGVISSGTNMILGYTGNAVASDIGTATIGGGGSSGRENIIGGNVTNVNTGTSNTTTTGTGADYSVITGGYDNVASGLASIISGFHNYTTSATTHGTIAGGSVHKIVAGDYNVIGGGQINEITAGDYCTIAGGGSHIINLPAGEDGGTIGGGFDHSITGRYSTIGGGNQNTASGVASTVGGGQINTASGAQSTVSGGDTNVAGGTASVVAGGAQITLSTTSARSDYAGALGGFQNTLGSGSAARFSGMLAGRSNTVNAEYAAILAGRECTASGEAAVAMGYGATASSPGQFAMASGYFSAAGDAQASKYVMRRQTTDATPTELRLGSTLGFRLLLSNDSLYAFHILVAGRGTGSDTQRGAYEIKGAISVTAAGSAAIVGTPTYTVLAEDDAAWDCAVVADTTNKALQINVTGAAATTINWVADVRLLKVTA